MFINGKDYDLRSERMKTKRSDGSGKPLSQEMVANQLGISCNQYQHYENNTTKNPKPSVVQGLIDIYSLR